MGKGRIEIIINTQSQQPSTCGCCIGQKLEPSGPHIGTFLRIIHLRSSEVLVCSDQNLTHPHVIAATLCRCSDQPRKPKILRPRRWFFGHVSEKAARQSTASHGKSEMKSLDMEIQPNKSMCSIDIANMQIYIQIIPNPRRRRYLYIYMLMSMYIILFIYIIMINDAPVHIIIYIMKYI